MGVILVLATPEFKIYFRHGFHRSEFEGNKVKKPFFVMFGNSPSQSSFVNCNPPEIFLVCLLFLGSPKNFLINYNWHKISTNRLLSSAHTSTRKCHKVSQKSRLMQLNGIISKILCLMNCSPIGMQECLFRRFIIDKTCSITLTLQWRHL